MCVKIYLYAIIFILVSAFASADCVDLEDNSTWGTAVEYWPEYKWYTIEKSVTLCNKEHNIGDGMIVLSENSVVFDCDGATITGSANNTMPGAIQVGRITQNYFVYWNVITVKNCNVHGFRTGIRLFKTMADTITNNTVSDCTSGIELYGAKGNTITHNTATGNDNGIMIDNYIGSVASHQNTISDNLLSGNSKNGIMIKLSRNNTITRNRIENNPTGINSSYSTIHLIYNNYLSNTINAKEVKGNNTWSIEPIAGTNIIGGETVAGNFWSDYTGDDADSDGIGDTPHTFLQYGSDDYPLFIPGMNTDDETETPAENATEDDNGGWNPFTRIIDWFRGNDKPKTVKNETRAETEQTTPCSCEKYEQEIEKLKARVAELEKNCGQKTATATPAKTTNAVQAPVTKYVSAPEPEENEIEQQEPEQTAAEYTYQEQEEYEEPSDEESLEKEEQAAPTTAQTANVKTTASQTTTATVLTTALKVNTTLAITAPVRTFTKR